MPSCENVYPLKHPSIFFVKRGLAERLIGVGRPEEARVIYETIRPVLRQEMPRDWITLMVLNNLGGLYRNLNRLDESRLVLEEAIEGLSATFGADHRNTLNCMSVLAIVLSSHEEF